MIPLAWHMPCNCDAPLRSQLTNRARLASDQSVRTGIFLYGFPSLRHLRLCASSATLRTSSGLRETIFESSVSVLFTQLRAEQWRGASAAARTCTLA